MKVKCINQNNFKDIRIDCEYELVETIDSFYRIVADSGNFRSYDRRYFEVIPEPIIEDVDEVGVVEEPQPEFTVEWNEEDDNNITIEVNGNKVVLYYYQVASNCGVSSYHGVNYLYENCDENIALFKDIMNVIINLVAEQNNCCMLIFSTNDEYYCIWDVLDEVMDLGSSSIENPNSDMNVKLWIKYLEDSSNNLY